MGLSYRASRILDRLHRAIRAQGQRGLDEFRTRLHELSLDGTQLATESSFAAAAAAGGDGVLSLEEAGIIFKELCSGSNDEKCVPFAKVSLFASKDRASHLYLVFYRGMRIISYMLRALDSAHFASYE